VSNPFIPIETADIQWSGNLPFSTLYNDIYHAVDSGIIQSRCVFIDGNDLISRWSAFPHGERHIFTIGETGFGTGLNFLLTWSLWERYAPNTATLHFISCEKHPLKLNDLDRALSNWPELENYKLELLKQYPILTPGNHHLIFNEGRVKLTLMLGDAFTTFEQLLICGESNLESQIKTCSIDAWYLDGFAPKKNESMWDKPLFNVITMLSKKESTFATYTVANIVKKNLAECGFEIIKRKGHGGKRHRLTGRLANITPIRLKQRSTPWHTKPQYYQERSALILGGGLAGCFTAHCLAKRGWQVNLLEAKSDIGQGASANPRAVLFPKLSAFRSPLTEFMLTSFLYAHRIYDAILRQVPIGELNGSLLIPHNAKEKNAHQCLTNWLSAYPELGSLIDAEQATGLAGIPLKENGLYIPFSGWVDSPALCNYLINHEKINVMNNMEITSLRYVDNQWLDDYHAPVLILANGYRVNQFNETKHLPIKPIRGQMTQIMSTTESNFLKVPLCAEGHVVPAVGGIHHLGATYELGSISSETNKNDDQTNIVKLAAISPIDWAGKPVNQWAGVRASTPDYLPLLGPIVKADEFLSLYRGLESNSKRWIAEEAPYYPGLYACAGFGSRGLTTIPLSAEWLASLINNEIVGAPRDQLQALAPARFLRRNIIRGLY
jgi:tRNA 5-methylaminomethyl-2-thiouridine biosynthesis bifunctional protein